MNMSPRAALVRLVVAGLLGVGLFLAITNAISNPAREQTRTLTAEFTDVSGLHDGADVRIRGVQVGKVTDVELERQTDRTIGVIDFSLATRYALGPDTKLAIKYQALTGLRYLDVANPLEGTTDGEITRAPTTMTIPSFDITTLFNGLQPVLSTLSPDEMNTFTDNAVALLEGDGSGLGPMLDSIQRLTRFVSDRQHVVSTLMQNLSAVADTLGGQSPQIVQILDWLNRPLDAALAVLDEFRKSDLYGPTFAGAALKVFDNLGLQRGLDIDELLTSAFTSLGSAADALGNLPAVLDGLAAPPATVEGDAMTCPGGHAALPRQVQVLLAGQKVILCNPA